MAYSIFTNQIPVNQDINGTEGQPGVTLGTAWYTEQDGVIRGVRFYLGNRNYDGAQIVAGIYDWETKQLLAQQNHTITNADPIGFNVINLSQQLVVKRNQRYIVAIYFPCDTSPDGKSHYVYTSGALAEEIAAPPLHAFKDETLLNRRNGVFHYGSGIAYPDSSFGSAAYFVDVAFDYVAKMPVYNNTTKKYTQHVVKYRESGEWKY